MKYLLILLVLGLLPIVGFMVGAAVSRRKNNVSELSRLERAELRSLRDMQYRLMQMAAQHTALGDNFAVIVADEIENTRRELSK